MVRVYVLLDPRNLEIRYVGVTTKTLEKRLGGHLYAARKGGRARRFIWMRSLLDAGVTPVAQQVSLVDHEVWAEAEQEWIVYLTSIGCDLVNGTAGGRGSLGCARHPWTDEMKHRASERVKKLMEDPEQRAKTSAATRKGMARYFAEHGDWWRQKKSEDMNAYYSDSANRQLASERTKKRWAREGQREQLSEKMKQVTANEKRTKCPNCDMVSRPAGIANHRKSKNH